MRIELSDCGFRYPKSNAPALQNISFTLESGDYCCVAGANGSGKSTLLKLLSGLLEGGKANGQVRCGDQNIAALSRRELAGLFAYVPGGLVVQFPITVRELLLQGRFPFNDRNESGTDKMDKVDEVVELLGLKKMESRLLSQLSWGESALAVLGRALVQQPRWLLLDEAISSLDIGMQRRAFTVLEKLNRERKTGILIVGHDLNLLTEFVPKAFWLHGGKILGCGPGPFEKILSDELLKEAYGPEAGLSVGTNPKNGKPKIFFV